ncbi:MAG: ArnT family glycosyltransferase [Nitrospinota bacterium]
MRESRSRLFFSHAALAIFLLALALRLLAVGDQWRAPPAGDGREYDALARSVLMGEGFHYEGPTSSYRSERLPLYPLFLAGIYGLSGYSLPAVRVVQVVLGAVTCLLIYALGVSIFDRRTGIIAGTSASLYGLFISYYGPASILTETLFTFVLWLLMWTVWKALPRFSLSYQVLCGVLMAAASLIKGSGSLLAIFFLLFLLISLPHGWKKASRALALTAGVLLLGLSPWLLRNYYVHGTLVFSTKGGYVFWESNNPAARGGEVIVSPRVEKPGRRLSELPPVERAYKEAEAAWLEAKRSEMERIASRYPLEGLSEVERNRQYFRRGLDYLSSNPGRLPKLLLRKALMHWNPIDKDYHFSYAVLVPFFLLGLVLAFRAAPGNRGLWLILLPVIYFQLIALVFYGYPRFRLPADGSLIILAALGIVWMARRVAQRPQWALPVAGWVGLNIFFELNAARTLGIFRAIFASVGLR